MSLENNSRAASASSALRPFVRLALAAALVLILSSSALARIAILEGPDPCYNITSHAEVLVDESRMLGFEEVASPAFEDAFTAIGSDSVRIGVVRAAVWHRITLMNPRQAERWVLEIDNAGMCEATLFYPNASAKSAGICVPPGSSEYFHPTPAFSLDLPANAERTFYLRVTHNGSIRFRALLWQDQAFRVRTVRWAVRAFLVEGVLLGLAGLWLCVFLGTRERTYLYFVLLLVSFLVSSMTRNGSGRLFLWPDAPWWADHSITFTGMLVLGTTLLFTRAFIRAPQYAPRYDRPLLFSMWMCLLLAALALTDLQIRFYFAQLMGVGAPLLAMLASYSAHRNGFTSARYILLAAAVSLVGVFQYVLLSVGFIPTSVWMEATLDLFFIAAIMLWTFALTHRLRYLERQERRRLEQEVQSRTQDLEDVRTQMSKLQRLLPLCSACGKIRDEQGAWDTLERYLRKRTDVDFSHGVCPECLQRLYPDYTEEDDTPAPPPTAS